MYQEYRHYIKIFIWYEKLMIIICQIKTILQFPLIFKYPQCETGWKIWQKQLSSEVKPVVHCNYTALVFIWTEGA